MIFSEESGIIISVAYEEAVFCGKSGFFSHKSQEVSDMAKCAVCGKGMVFGNAVSHSHRKTNRTWKPNIRKVRISENGTVKTVSICARCLRTMKKQQDA